MLVCLFPPEIPVTVPRDYVKSPYEEFVVNNRPFLDLAVAQNKPHVSFIWHPWSLQRLDSRMRMLELTFTYVKQLGMDLGNFASFQAALEKKRAQTPAPVTQPDPLLID